MTAALTTALRDLPVFLPGSRGYAAATAPMNLVARQAPAAVVRPTSSHDVARAVRAARDASLLVSVQATGHGAARTLGPETLLVDTRDLAAIEIDPRRRLGLVGAGAVWGEVQSAASAHGLLGLAGTSAGVGVAGYTFGGGVGWFTRAHGLASGKLRAVDYVDGLGRRRRAADDAEDPVDREAIWAFRGGAPVGVATGLEIELIRPGELWAGHLLWPAEHVDELVTTWARALPKLPASVTSTMALLQLPPAGPFPPELLGTTVVHLSYVSDGDRTSLARLRELLRAVATPTIDSTGAADLDRLARIHLDPPRALAAVGGARWLTAADDAADLLLSAGVGDGSVAMAELRHVASTASALPGAVTRVPGPFLLHLVGHGEDERREDTFRAIRQALVRSADLDAGVDPISFREGDAESAADAEHGGRLRSARAAVDPDHVFRFERAGSSSGTGLHPA